ncbi:hypothetical protein [Caproicibacter fermentans]|uniref:hypothetical protein n=1 Tax=Caproicibacter fermentans TaxID=2576756 RepID=UPI0012EEAE7D|nr:hypothetical protein [Caproicibacter fermentans]
MSGKQIIWENKGKVMDTVIVSANDDESESAVKKYLIEMLTNKANPVFQRDWSKFGQSGDCIKII